MSTTHSLADLTADRDRLRALRQELAALTIERRRVQSRLQALVSPRKPGPPAVEARRQATIAALRAERTALTSKILALQQEIAALTTHLRRAEQAFRRRTGQP
jgi:predicted  nucleic acid-binding Zn-ribbon protein